MKNYLGRIPSTIDGWSLQGKFAETNGVEWLVFIKKQDHSEKWKTVKVVANGRVSRKANYWFSANFETGEIGFSRDFNLIKTHRPDLFLYLEAFFKSNIRL